MSWPASILISVLSGILGVVCAGLIAQLCTGWYRISSFEGGAGYFVIFTALLGGLAAVVIGLIVAWLMPAGAESAFFKGLGAASGAVLVIALVALVICRLCADLAPTLDGKELELEIEVRCPKGFQIPSPDEYGAVAGVYLPGGRRLPTAKIRVDAAQTVDGQLVVSASVPLTTSSSRKFLDVRFNKDHDLLFSLPLRPRPIASDLEWSKWVEAAWDADGPRPLPEANFHARYRVRTIEPPPPEPNAEEVRAQDFAALDPDAPLKAWLPFLFEEPNAERTRVVVERINARQAELAQLIRSPDATLREYALEAAKYPPQPAPEVIEAVLAEGRAIADGIRTFNTMPEDDPRFHEVLLDLRTRFKIWKQAWWGLSQRLGLDGRPPVREIHDLATVRARGTAMDEIELNARVILEALDKSAAEEKP